MLTFERQQRKEIRVWVQQTKMSQCEKLTARESRIIREPAHKRTKLLKTDFQCRSWNKEQGIEDLQAPVSCSCLSLLGETLFMCIFFCPPVVRCGAVRHCHMSVSYTHLRAHET